ncbi:unnamed protein product [Urochloa decumbens]|uniref:poly(A)-specific ribonuclease n=1 Tax=Urochloa decumbens TaxID=240449 RepID=A0ABC9E9T8_9POAL
MLAKLPSPSNSVVVASSAQSSMQSTMSNLAVQSFLHPAAMQPPFHYAGAASLHAPPPPPPPVVPVRVVWAGNLDAELRFLRVVSTSARFVAFAVHYPGVVVVHDDHNALTAEQRYATTKANADALKPLQVGLAVGTRDGHCLAWEFNLRGFDRAADPHAPGSVRYLEEERGMDLDAHRARGIPMARLTDALHRSGLLHRRDLPWICHAGAYHLAYLLKVIRGGLPLPDDMRGFFGTVRRFLGGDVVYDVACVAGDCPFLPVGLERIADKLDLARPVGSPLLAGAGAVLALQAFVFLQVCVFQGDVQRYRGLLHGLQVT